ncbi:hypothetical protein IP88_04115 [alpha proteobacterium AAP81b]|nr:hypothetical protein IP88_04115 [alpha proteobacterium AAP81b]
MPRGKPYQLEGLLLPGRFYFLTLSLDGGGYWELDGPPKLRRLIGRRVRISGVRGGFNLIDVHKFEPA